jgi:transcriptional regulator with XRE-family HTH domain
MLRISLRVGPALMTLVFTIFILPGDGLLWRPLSGITLIGRPLPVNLGEHVSFTSMSDRDSKTAEEYVGANIKALRAQLGLTQAELAEAMQELGHSWIQTTVAKTEGADRPLRVNEVADLAQILGTRLPELVSSHGDWNRQAITAMLSHFQGHAARLTMDIEELTQQLAGKRQQLEDTLKRVDELQREAAEVRVEH